MKIAFTGSSGSGKTTLCKFVSEQLSIPHISGSSGDLKTHRDKEDLMDEGLGHKAVIRRSAMNANWALKNQTVILNRRTELIQGTHPLFPGVRNFVTDRSPADNIVYFMTQAAYHDGVNDMITGVFLEKAKRAWNQLTHVIYLRAVQPDTIEVNGSRVPNKYYQQSIDALFNYWISEYLWEHKKGPKVLDIGFWGLERRKEEVLKFLKTDTI